MSAQQNNDDEENNVLYKQMKDRITRKNFHHLLPILSRLKSIAMEFDKFHLMATVQGFNAFSKATIQHFQDKNENVTEENLFIFKSLMQRVIAQEQQQNDKNDDNTLKQPPIKQRKIMKNISSTSASTLSTSASALFQITKTVEKAAEQETKEVAAEPTKQIAMINNKLLVTCEFPFAKCRLRNCV